MTIASERTDPLVAAAEAGDTYAQFRLAEALRKGEGAVQDLEAALHWYRAAAEQGHADAQNNLGSMYLNATGTPRDVDAAELGDVVAMGNLSDYREDLERLALDGSLTATHFLARMYERGLAVEQDNAILYAWVRWGARECGPRADDDLRASLPAWLALLEQDLPAADQERGLATLAVFEAARDALHRDWGKRPA